MQVLVQKVNSFLGCCCEELWKKDRITNSPVCPLHLFMLYLLRGKTPGGRKKYFYLDFKIDTGGRIRATNKDNPAINPNDQTIQSKMYHLFAWFCNIGSTRSL